jgi:hypothetical protein
VGFVGALKGEDADGWGAGFCAITGHDCHPPSPICGCKPFCISDLQRAIFVNSSKQRAYRQIRLSKGLRAEEAPPEGPFGKIFLPTLPV